VKSGTAVSAPLNLAIDFSQDNGHCNSASTDRQCPTQKMDWRDSRSPGTPSFARASASWPVLAELRSTRRVWAPAPTWSVVPKTKRPPADLRTPSFPVARTGWRTDRNQLGDHGLQPETNAERPRCAKSRRRARPLASAPGAGPPQPSRKIKNGAPKPKHRLYLSPRKLRFVTDSRAALFTNTFYDVTPAPAWGVAAAAVAAAASFRMRW
jgi:hypothetical protein